MLIINGTASIPWVQLDSASLIPFLQALPFLRHSWAALRKIDNPFLRMTFQRWGSPFLDHLQFWDDNRYLQYREWKPKGCSVWGMWKIRNPDLSQIFYECFADEGEGPSFSNIWIFENAVTWASEDISIPVVQVICLTSLWDHHWGACEGDLGIQIDESAWIYTRSFTHASIALALDFCEAITYVKK